MMQKRVNLLSVRSPMLACLVCLGAGYAGVGLEVTSWEVGQTLPRVIQSQFLGTVFPQFPLDSHPVPEFVGTVAGSWMTAWKCIDSWRATFSSWILSPVKVLVLHLHAVGRGWMFWENDRIVPQGVPENLEKLKRSSLNVTYARNNISTTIEELERKTQAFIRMEAQRRTLWEHAAGSSFIVDSSGMILDMNHRAETTFGCHKDQLIGTSSLTLIAEEDRPRFAQWLHHVQDRGGEWLGEEFQVRPPNGACLILESNVVPMERSLFRRFCCFNGTI